MNLLLKILYTAISLAADKSPALRIKNKNDDKLDEGIMDSLKSLATKIKAWAKSTVKWAVSYDKKLAELKARAAVK